MYNIKLYQMIRQNGGWDMFSMIPIKKFPCNDKREAEAEEEICRKELRAVMNSMRIFVSKEEARTLKNEHQRNYSKEHREETRIYNRNYRKEHIHEINQKNKQYRDNHKEELDDYHKKYNTAHRDEINEKQRNYNKKNKEVINQRDRKRYLYNKKVKELLAISLE